MDGLIGKKQDQLQGFLQDGTRVPLTVVAASGNWVTQLKTQDHDGYSSIKLAFGKSNKKDKAGKNLPAFFREIEGENVQVGTKIKPADVFKPGDIVDVSGVSKGKGFAGVVKRHHFKGGPRTHGQSDRERAPGSIGQTTTPGHVYRGKRMAGHMGHTNVTVKNLEVIEITDDGRVFIKGLVPGPRNSIVVVKKVGENKKFVPLYKEPSSAEAPAGQGEVQLEQKVEVQTPAEDVQTQEEVKTAEQTVQTPVEEVKTVEEKEVSAEAKAMADKKENAS